MICKECKEDKIDLAFRIKREDSFFTVLKEICRECERIKHSKEYKKSVSDKLSIQKRLNTKDFF